MVIRSRRRLLEEAGRCQGERHVTTWEWLIVHRLGHVCTALYAVRLQTRTLAVWQAREVPLRRGPSPSVDGPSSSGLVTVTSPLTSALLSHGPSRSVQVAQKQREFPGLSLGLCNAMLCHTQYMPKDHVRRESRKWRARCDPTPRHARVQPSVRRQPRHRQHEHPSPQSAIPPADPGTRETPE